MSGRRVAAARAASPTAAADAPSRPARCAAGHPDRHDGIGQRPPSTSPSEGGDGGREVETTYEPVASHRRGRASMQRLNMVSLARLAPIGLGVAFGLFFVFTSPLQHAPLWPVWASLAVALTTTAGAVFPYGLDRWAELAELSKRPTVRVRDVATRVTAIAAITLLVIILGSLRLLGSQPWRPVALLTFTILGSVPAVGVMDGVRRTADNESALGVTGEQVAVLVRLRQLLQRLLAAVGSVVALSTLATGASLAPQPDLPAESAHTLPPQFALFYLPAATAIQRRGQRLCDELFPLDEAEEVSAILSLAEGRQKLEQLLGVDHGVIADLQTGLAILGPLLASAAAAFLSP